MATKNEHAGKAQSEKGASGQKGVSQEQVGSGKEHDPNNFAKDPGARKGGWPQGWP